MNQNFKTILFDYCQDFLDQRIKTLNDAIAASRLSSWEDTKSSAGDKYETGREMIQGEIAQNSRQLEEAQKLIPVLDQIKGLDSSPGTVILGSLIKTNQGYFYISIPIGMVEIEKEKIAILSSSSPLGGVLMGKSPGNKFQFNGRSYIIEEVY